MRTKDFLSRLDHKAIVSAIRSAEARSSGQIRVYIQRGEFKGDALTEARSRFQKLGMEKTLERNGILIFVLPRAQKFAVVGDEGIHANCGDVFWNRLVESMRAHFLNSNFTDAMVGAIEEAGQLLARHFPRKDSSKNELPDDIIEG